LADLDDPDEWDCEICIENKKQGQRNCPHLGDKDFIQAIKSNPMDKYGFTPIQKRIKKGRTEERTILKIGKVDYTECKITSITPRLQDAISFVNWCEGQGGARLPSELVNETQYYLNLRNIIMSEQSRVMKENMDNVEKQNVAKKPYKQEHEVPSPQPGKHKKAMLKRAK